MNPQDNKKFLLPDTTKYLLEFVNLGKEVWSGKADFFNEKQYTELCEIHLKKWKRNA